MTEKETNTDKETDLRLNSLVGLLDFYSDRAIAHASFLVACVFGLFTLLAIVQNIAHIWLKVISIFPYFIFCYIGHSCLQRFAFYATIAQDISSYLQEKYAKLEYIPVEFTLKNGTIKTSLPEKIRILTEIYEKTKIKKILRKHQKSAEVVVFVLPFLIVYLPTLYQALLIIFRTLHFL